MEQVTDTAYAFLLAYDYRPDMPETVELFRTLVAEAADVLKDNPSSAAGHSEK